MNYFGLFDLEGVGKLEDVGGKTTYVAKYCLASSIDELTKNILKHYNNHSYKIDYFISKHKEICLVKINNMIIKDEIVYMVDYNALYITFDSIEILSNSIKQEALEKIRKYLVML